MISSAGLKPISAHVACVMPRCLDQWRAGRRDRTAIMIEVDPDVSISVYDYVGLKDYIAGLFSGPVDVVSRDSLKPHVRPAVADAIYAF